MGNIKMLDCTLRDGGYCNQWMFGEKKIKKTISSLTNAGIDIIECGFLTDKSVYEKDVTLFNTLAQISPFIPEERGKSKYVCMINYGEYEAADLPFFDGSSVDGIRVVFHKRETDDALKLCEEIKAKGYEVFIQAMVSLSFSDEEFLRLIYSANKIDPYAFYIVDSFGMMKRHDLVRLFYLIEHNLSETISIGYHSHNNMQLAYSNAQALVDIQTKRNIILDSSVFGMGRGAGNLNTELFLEYLNDSGVSTYDLKPVLNIIDEIVNPFFHQNPWGYSLPNYLSAKYNAHPNYAGYLADRHTLTVEDMDGIFKLMDEDKKIDYSTDYIEELYSKYLRIGNINEAHLCDFKEQLAEKKVLLIAPGSSVQIEKEKICLYASDPSVVSISVNFDYPHFKTDFIFVSNLRRFRELDPKKASRIIATSNICASTDVYLQTDFFVLTNHIDAVRDNAGLMLIKYLICLGVHEIAIAGIDGYSHEGLDNFAEKDMSFFSRSNVFDAMNSGLNEMIDRYSREANITFVTTPRFVHTNSTNL